LYRPCFLEKQVLSLKELETVEKRFRGGSKGNKLDPPLKQSKKTPDSEPVSEGSKKNKRGGLYKRIPLKHI